jgi:formylglycine-generating enzyme required for sulfatase activity
MSEIKKSVFKEPEMVRIIHQKPEKVMKFSMVRVPKGSFMMGSNEYGDEKPVHQVTIEHAFEIGKYPVTFEEYDLFCEDTGQKKPDDNGWGRGKRPVINISWYDAIAYCAWLSQKSGHSFTLPSEAQWEYSCRAGTTTRWGFGDDENELEKYALHRDSSKLKTHPVGEKLKNGWGLFDMHGNVWEWCADDYVDSYKYTPRDGTAHQDEKVNSKVVRGGSWFDDAFNTRSANRFNWHPDVRGNDIGFRLLRTLP